MPTSLDSPKRSTPPSGDPSKLYGYPPSWTRPASSDGAPKPDPIAEALHSIADTQFDFNTEQNRVARAIGAAFISPNVMDSNWEAANVVDALAMIARSLHDVADAIREAAAPPTWDTASQSVVRKPK
jgi:hypothetical protein